MTLEVQQLPDGSCHVSLTVDGFTASTVVSSYHLVEEKRQQLQAAIARQAAAAYDLAS
jgi:hypothetical protein